MVLTIQQHRNKIFPLAIQHERHRFRRLPHCRDQYHDIRRQNEQPRRDAGSERQPEFCFRILAEFESTAINTANANYVAANSSSSYAGTGTSRFDMVTVSGSAIATTPSAPPVLSAPATISGNQFQFTITGSAGSNYVIQVSTNLAGSNWISIFTNAAPFTFTDSNANFIPQGFYRAIAAP